METIKDFCKSIIDSYSERVKNPVIGTFVTSYLIFNWKSIAILLVSNWPINERIAWIELNYSKPGYYLYPLAVTIVYVFVLPYFNLYFVEWILQKYTDKKSEKRKEQRMSELIRQRDEAEIIREIADAKAGTSEINRLNERNEALKVENNILVEQNKDDISRHNTTIQQLKAKDEDYKREIVLLEKVLNDTKDNFKYNSLNMLFSHMKSKVIEADKTLSTDDKIYFCEYFFRLNTGVMTIMDSDHINKFVRLDLIEMDTLIDDKPGFNLTDIGKEFYEFLVREGYRVK